MEEIKLKAILKAIDDKKGEDIVFIDVQDKNPYCLYYVLCTVSSTRKANAIIEGIEEEMKNLHEEICHIEGDPAVSKWILIDVGDIVVHVFTPEERERVNLEDLLKKCKSYCFGELNDGTKAN